MLRHYQELVRLLEREEMVLRQVASFYQGLAESLKLGQLPALPELFAGGARSSDDLKKIAGEKRELFDEIKVDSLHQLLASQYPAKIRHLVALKGAAIAKLRRKIEASGISIRQSLSALQVVNKRFCDFFQQLCPATISYQGKGMMADNSAAYRGVTLNGIA
ncbi:MAG: hypothetical protein U9Q58_02135 [Pseudomonadota bacterium]|nr:hypothetical protein [Pseudomonadota bacterium]